MHADPNAANQYLRDPSAMATAGWETAWRLVSQNAADLTALVLDRESRPIITEYWNEHGRLWPWFLLPFATIGAVAAVSRWWREGTIVALLPLVLAFGLALPLVLTSRVHVGRLLPALPFALLLVAAGAAIAAGWLAGLLRHVGAGALAPVAAPLVGVAILIPATITAHADLRTPLAPTREARTVETLAAWQNEAIERGGAVLVEDPMLGDEIEGVHAATYRLDLDPIYRFVDLRHEDAAQPADARTALSWRGALRALEAGELARPCQRFWFVAPETTADFLAAWHAAGCPGAPDSVILP
jgi:hypothetical protein